MGRGRTDARRIDEIRHRCYAIDAAALLIARRSGGGNSSARIGSPRGLCQLIETMYDAGSSLLYYPRFHFRGDRGGWEFVNGSVPDPKLEVPRARGMLARIPRGANGDGNLLGAFNVCRWCPDTLVAIFQWNAGCPRCVYSKCDLLVRLSRWHRVRSVYGWRTSDVNILITSGRSQVRGLVVVAIRSRLVPRSRLE